LANPWANALSNAFSQTLRGGSKQWAAAVATFMKRKNKVGERKGDSENERDR
jgi:hypothetical protein